MDAVQLKLSFFERDESSTVQQRLLHETARRLGDEDRRVEKRDDGGERERT
jgi:hypothetical protein